MKLLKRIHHPKTINGFTQVQPDGTGVKFKQALGVFETAFTSNRNFGDVYFPGGGYVTVMVNVVRIHTRSVQPL